MPEGFFISSQNGIICSVKDKLFIEENCVYTESILAFLIMLLKLILCPLNSIFFWKYNHFKASSHFLFQSSCNSHLSASLGTCFKQKKKTRGTIEPIHHRYWNAAQPLSTIKDKENTLKTITKLL